MKLLLHVGRPKTGTTSLQQFFRVNQDALRESGYLVFDDIGGPNNIELAAYFEDKPQPGTENWRRRRGISSRADWRAYFRQFDPLLAIRRQVADHAESTHTAIITSEHLAALCFSKTSMLKLSEWAHRQFSAIEVVFFVRHQVRAIPSGWSTLIRSGGTRSLHSFFTQRVRGRHLDYEIVAQKWTSAFGVDKVRFHVFREDTDWDIRTFFSETYLEPIQPLRFPKQKANQALSRAQAEAWRAINRLLPYWTTGARQPNLRNIRARKAVDRIIGNKGPSIALSQAQAQVVTQRFSASNTEFSRKFLPPGEVL